MNIARRATRDLTAGPVVSTNQQPTTTSTPKLKIRKTVKIGRPGYKVIKERDTDTNQLSLTFYVDYPEIDIGIKPRYRFMSAFEQRVEVPDKNYQYLLFAAEPYETIAFKIPNKDIEKSAGPQVPGESKFWTKWDETINQFSLQLHFKPQPKRVHIIETVGRKYDPMQPKKEEAPLQDPRASYAYFNK